MNDTSTYDDLSEDDEAAWHCHSCPIRYLTVIALGFALAVMIVELINRCGA
ncbi:hypothetical protein [Phyllobacterium sp. SB3]|uniref:hypothetical protein n=1 Tax=Phyllobacterium sp. SB3 TaxID=3156073 RepID=UPI0032AE8899